MKLAKMAEAPAHVPTVIVIVVVAVRDPSAPSYTIWYSASFAVVNSLAAVIAPVAPATAKSELVSPIEKNRI